MREALALEAGRGTDPPFLVSGSRVSFASDPTTLLGRSKKDGGPVRELNCDPDLPFSQETPFKYHRLGYLNV